MSKERGYQSSLPPTTQDIFAPETNNGEAHTQALAILEDGTLESRRYQLSSVGLILRGDLTEDEWTQLGKTLRKLEGAIQWLIGDWLVYGERTWGKTYAEVAAYSGYAVQTLRDFASVAAHVDLSLRNDELSFNHHRAIAYLEPEQQAQFLALAISEGWSVRQLREAVDPPAPPRHILSHFRKIFAHSERKIEELESVFDRVGGDERAEISQLIDDEIAYLEGLKRKL